MNIWSAPRQTEKAIRNKVKKKSNKIKAKEGLKQ
jgi:hypothetical protein